MNNMLSEWNVTIAGAVVCVIFSWFLGIVSRSQEMQFGKTGPAVGIVGIFILAGMGVTGPPQHPSIRDNSVQSTSNGRVERLRLVARRTREKCGPRPNGNYVAYENATGELAWVTILEYKILRHRDKEK